MNALVRKKSETLAVRNCLNLIPRMAQQPLVGQGHLVIED